MGGRDKQREKRMPIAFGNEKRKINAGQGSDAEQASGAHATTGDQRKWSGGNGGGVAFGYFDDFAVAHVEDAVSDLGGFGVVRDHEDGLA